MFINHALPVYADPYGWAAKADAAEIRRDWDRAAEYWWRASTSLRGNPRGLRTLWQRREDAAKAKSGCCCCSTADEIAARIPAAPASEQEG